MEDNEVRLKSVPVNEQETSVLYMRDESFASIYSSDSTQITRLDKLCKINPDMYKCIEDNGISKRYICKDKSLISFRSKKRELTEEQKKLAGERMRKYHEDKERYISILRSVF